MEKRHIITARHEWLKRELAYRMRRAMTPMEKKLWQRLRASRLGGLHFWRQQIIDGFIVDFLCLAPMLVVEVDGAVHASQAEYDAERDKMLEFHDLMLLRFPNSRVETELNSVLSEIALIAHRRLKSRR